jgi:hypothetical protein
VAILGIGRRTARYEFDAFGPDIRPRCGRCQRVCEIIINGVDGERTSCSNDRRWHQDKYPCSREQRTLGSCRRFSMLTWAACRARLSVPRSAIRCTAAAGSPQSRLSAPACPSSGLPGTSVVFQPPGAFAARAGAIGFAGQGRRLNFLARAVEG